MPLEFNVASSKGSQTHCGGIPPRCDNNFLKHQAFSWRG